MKKPTIVYKVVRKTINGMFSLMFNELPSSIVLKYELGKETKAKGSSYIFCFKTLDAAKCFADFSLECILECETTDKPKKIKARLSLVKVWSSFHDFWYSKSPIENHRLCSDCCAAPEGTIGVRSLTPKRVVELDIEQIYYENNSSI